MRVSNVGSRIHRPIDGNFTILLLKFILASFVYFPLFHATRISGSSRRTVVLVRQKAVVQLSGRGGTPPSEIYKVEGGARSVYSPIGQTPLNPASQQTSTSTSFIIINLVFSILLEKCRSFISFIYCYLQESLCATRFVNNSSSQNARSKAVSTRDSQENRQGSLQLQREQERRCHGMPFSSLYSRVFLGLTRI